MGLIDKDSDIFKEEESGLKNMGIPTSIKPIDEQIDSYFAQKQKKKTKTVLPSNDSVGCSCEIDAPRLLKVDTFGFKNGVLNHNMPCPVCLNEQAQYISNEDGNYFAPCEACEAIGYRLEKIKKKGFWNG